MTNSNKHNVLTVMGHEFIIRESFFVSINEEGIVEPITLEHLFISKIVVGLRTLAETLKMIQANAQECANRAQNRGVPLNEFKVRVDQSFDVGLQKDNWRFEFTLVFQNGEEAYDDDEDFPDIDPAEAFPE